MPAVRIWSHESLISKHKVYVKTGGRQLNVCGVFVGGQPLLQDGYGSSGLRLAAPDTKLTIPFVRRSDPTDIVIERQARFVRYVVDPTEIDPLHPKNQAKLFAYKSMDPDSGIVGTVQFPQLPAKQPSPKPPDYLAFFSQKGSEEWPKGLTDEQARAYLLKHLQDVSRKYPKTRAAWEEALKTGKIKLPGGGTAWPAALADYYVDKCRKFNANPLLALYQDEAESDFRPMAKSPAGAEGMCQFMPGTAKTYGLKDPNNPFECIDAQLSYMEYLNKLLDNPALAFAGYNAGENAVLRTRDKQGRMHIPNTRGGETLGYVTKITEKAGAAMAELSQHPHVSTTFELLEIVGDKEFTARVTDAIRVLKQKLPGHLAFVQAHLSRIVQADAERSGSVTPGSGTRTFRISGITLPIWTADEFAAVLGHEAYHEYDYKEYAAKRVSSWNDSAGRELAANKFQIEVLEAMGVPESKIAYLRTADGKHPDCNGDGVVTPGENYVNCGS